MILNLSPLAAPRTILAAPTTAAAERRCMWCGTYDLGERGCEPYTVQSEPAAPVMRFARWFTVKNSQVKMPVESHQRAHLLHA